MKHIMKSYSCASDLKEMLCGERLWHHGIFANISYRHFFYKTIDDALDTPTPERICPECLDIVKKLVDKKIKEAQWTKKN